MISPLLSAIVSLEVLLTIIVVYCFVKYEKNFIEFEDKIIHKIKKSICKKKTELCAKWLAKQGLVVTKIKENKK